MDWLNNGVAEEMDDWLEINAPMDSYRVYVAGMVLEIDDDEIAVLFKLRFQC
jgi:hypothetical protein